MPSSLSRLLAVLTAAVFSPIVTHAQDAVPELERVVVTATRSPLSIDRVLGDVTVIDRKTLDTAGPTGVAEVLARQPGMQFYSNGGPQTPTGVMLRGTNPNQTLVLIDGVRANSAIQGGFLWAALDPATIERIEIVRGVGSSLYGSDAMGGVINIITRKDGADRPLSAYTNMGLGSQGYFESGAGLSGARDGWDYAFAANMAQSDGFNTTNPQAGSHTFNADKDGYERHSVSGSLGYRWKPGQHLGFSAYNSYINSDYDAGEFLHPAIAITRQQAYTLTSTNDINSVWQSVLRLGLAKEAYDDRAYGTEFSSIQRSYTWQNNFRLTPNHQISTVLERLEERPRHSGGLEADQRNTNAAGLIYRGDFGRHHLQGSVRHDNITGFGSETTGALAYDFDLNDAWTVGVGGSTGFRAPTFTDLYSPWGANPDLKPERSRNVEASVRYDDGASRYSATVYQNKIRDLITYESALMHSVNTDRATLRGITLTAERSLGNTTLRASADFLDPKDDATDQILVRRARQVYNLGADHRFGRLLVGAEYQFTGRREDTAYDDNFNPQRVKLGSYGLVNLSAQYDLSERATVQVRWNNVLDKQYTQVAGYNTPGSTFFVNLSLRM